MTPTADCGEEGKLTFREFMRKFGWPGKKGDGRIVFNGVFRYKKPNTNSKYFIDISGYEENTKEFDDILSSIIVCLLNENFDGLVSGWSFQKLLDGWSKKHMSACYVEYQKKAYAFDGHDAKYCFTGRVFICEQSTIFKYLNAIVENNVYYDPGHEIKATGESKVRPQWRLSVTQKLGNKLNGLYEKVTETSLQ